MARVDLGEVMRAKGKDDRPRSHQYILILVAVLIVIAAIYILLVYGNRIIGYGNEPGPPIDYGNQPPALPGDTGAGSSSGSDSGFDNDLPPPPPPSFP